MFDDKSDDLWLEEYYSSVQQCSPGFVSTCNHVTNRYACLASIRDIVRCLPGSQKQYNYENPEGSSEIRIRNSKFDIRDTSSFVDQVHDHYEMTKTKYDECSGSKYLNELLI